MLVQTVLCHNYSSAICLGLRDLFALSSNKQKRATVPAARFSFCMKALRGDRGSFKAPLNASPYSSIEAMNASCAAISSADFTAEPWEHAWMVGFSPLGPKKGER